MFLCQKESPSHFTSDWVGESKIGFGRWKAQSWGGLSKILTIGHHGTLPSTNARHLLKQLWVCFYAKKNLRRMLYHRGWSVCGSRELDSTSTFFTSEIHPPIEGGHYGTLPSSNARHLPKQLWVCFYARKNLRRVLHHRGWSV